jgi:hypothetical protein
LPARWSPGSATPANVGARGGAATYALAIVITEDLRSLVAFTLANTLVAASIDLAAEVVL